MGQPKQLLPWRQDETTLLGHAVDAALSSTADEVVVVLGYQADACRAAVSQSGFRPLRVVVNDEWSTGMASSVRAGLGTVPDAEAVVFVPIDQPWITPALIDRVIAAHRATGQPIAMLRCGERRAPPALFARATFPALQELTGDQGGRALVDAYADRVAWVDLDEDEASTLTDVDTPADYARFRAEQGFSVSER